MQLTFQQQYQVYAFYVGDFTIPLQINCPFPNEGESNPSFGIYLSSDGESIIWSKRNEMDRSGNAFSFVRAMEGISPGLAARRIRDIIKGRVKSDMVVTSSIPKVKKQTPHELITSTDFTDCELEWWWNEAGMTREDLLVNNVYSLESLSYGSLEVEWKKIGQPKFVFEYYDDDGNRVGWKFYSPQYRLGERKWRSGGDLQLGNYRNLPQQSKYLFILTGKKDMMVFYKHVLKRKYPCIYNPSETSIAQLMDKWYDLDERFTNIIYIGDTDYNEHRTGQRVAEKIEEKLGIQTINFVYTGEEVKDITEEWKFCGGDVSNIISQLNIKLS